MISSQWSLEGSYTQSAAWTPLELVSGAPLLTLVSGHYHLRFSPHNNDNDYDGFDFSVERYCPRTNEWQTVAAMHESRSNILPESSLFVVIVITGGRFSSYA